jgi:hypothetical protein
VADVVDRFVEILGLEHYALYVFDFGAPSGSASRLGTRSA